MGHVKLPEMYEAELARMPEEAQRAFNQEYHRKAKGRPLAYILDFVGFHYAYLGRWGAQIFFWLTGGGLLVWWIIDFFRVGRMVKDHNRDVAAAVLVQVKAIAS